VIVAVEGPSAAGKTTWCGSQPWPTVPEYWIGATPIAGSDRQDVRQPFRLADNDHVTGIDLAERLHTTEPFNVISLHGSARGHDLAASESRCGQCHRAFPAGTPSL
jgi:hypothetical protein